MACRFLQELPPLNSRYVAMAAIKLEHTDLAKHGFGMFQELRELWKEGHLCDVVLKSNDGIEHRAHTTVLSAASKVLKKLLLGSFLEADQRKSGEPVEIAASANVVSVLLDYIYGGQPDLLVSDSIELLRLADAYDCPTLAAAVETGLRSSLDKPQPDIAVALTVLLQTQGLHDLKAACEATLARNFAACVQHPDFLKLDACQLGRIVERVDLEVPREEDVLKGIFKWFNHSSKERRATLSLLLRDVEDFQAISSGNLAQIKQFASSIGPGGDDLQRRVNDALQAHKKRSATESPDGFRPKRQCLQHWSPHLGASSKGSGQEVFSLPVCSLCWHEGTIYAAATVSNCASVVCWKPGETAVRTVAGEGARVAGINDLGKICMMCVLPDGSIITADRRRLVSFHNGSGQLLVGDNEVLKDLRDVFCSPNGVVYVVTRDGAAVYKLVGTTLQPVILSEHLPEEMRFKAWRFFVTNEEVIYLADRLKSCVLRISPGETQPVLVCKVPVSKRQASGLSGLSVSKDGTIYVAEFMQKRVFAFNPGDETCTEVLACPEGLAPDAVLVQDRSLYVSMYKKSGNNSYIGFVRKYFLSPQLQLE